MTAFLQIASCFVLMLRPSEALRRQSSYLHMQWIGPVIASEQAIYLVARRRPWYYRMYDMRTLPATWKAEREAADRACRHGPYAMHDLSTLDDVIRHPDWPLGETTDRCLVMLKHTVEELSWPVWHVLTLRSGEQHVRIHVSIFQRRRVLNFLREMQWNV